MINYYFGLPGAGKTTHLVATALKVNRQINKGRSPYKRVLSNVRFSVPKGETSHCFFFDNEDFGNFDMSYSLILFDESQMSFDNRDYKSLKSNVRNFLMLHRHYKCNIFFYNQTYDGIDKKIRFITNNVYYLKRNLISGKTVPHRIKYMMYIPKKPKHDMITSGAENGEITMRYYQAGFFEHLFSKLFLEPPVKLKRYFNYFDSFEAPALPVKEFVRL